MTRDQVHHHFYEQLAKLPTQKGQGLPLAQYSGQSALPRAGLYLFIDPHEQPVHPAVPGRIVRVGTHGVAAGSRSTLWQRLRAHKGTQTGSGNHRGSIFRLHIGTALQARDCHELPWWGRGSSRPVELKADLVAQEKEKAHERRVSAYLGELHLAWLEVPGESGAGNQRARLERYLITLLSGMNGGKPTIHPRWLGLSSPRAAIAGSGLWNLEHVGSPWSDVGSDLLEETFEAMAGHG
ncbi:hypothetical protein [Salinicola halophyticus]|uniref:hypothetical protein n=1 Tax=Salinicola halophyticus TaxID=1808881 RepID=UPI003F466845